MGHEHQRAVPAAEELFEPVDRVDVQVVGRLVQQQQVGLGRPAPGPAAPAASCPTRALERSLRRPAPSARGSASTAARLARRSRPSPRAARRRRPRARSAGQILRARPAATATPSAPGAEPRSPPSGSISPESIRSSVDLARPVAAQQADPLPRLDLAGDVVQQRRPAKLQRQIADADQRHGASPNDRRDPSAVGAPMIESSRAPVGRSHAAGGHGGSGFGEPTRRHLLS